MKYLTDSLLPGFPPIFQNFLPPSLSLVHSQKAYNPLGSLLSFLLFNVFTNSFWFISPTTMATDSKMLNRCWLSKHSAKIPCPKLFQVDEVNNAIYLTVICRVLFECRYLSHSYTSEIRIWMTIGTKNRKSSLKRNN